MEVDGLDDADALRGLDEVEEVKVPQVVLLSKTGTEHTLDLSDAVLCGLLRTAVEMDPEAFDKPFPVDIDAQPLCFILEYLRHQKGVPAQIPEKPLRQDKWEHLYVDRWHLDWVQRVMSQGKIFFYSLLTAANYLDCRCLLEICVAALAQVLKSHDMRKYPAILSSKTDLYFPLEEKK